jgi:hypothetical protein
MAVPPFHIFGLYYQFMQPIAGTCVAVYTPTGAIPGALPITPSADNILEHARITKCRSLVTVPVMLALWSESPAALKYLKTLDRIVRRMSFHPLRSVMNNMSRCSQAAPCPSASGMIL